MSVWERPRPARAGESDRAKHYTYVVRWRLGGTRDGKWQSVTIGHTRGHKRAADEIDERVASLGYNVTAADVRGWLASDPEADDDAPAQPPTVHELVDAWVHRANKSAGTRAAYATVAKRLGDLGAIRADRLTHAHVNRWLVGLESAGMSQSTLLRCLVTLKGATKGHVDRAVFEGLRYDNTARKVHAIYLTTEQVLALRDAAKGTALWLPVWVMGECGLRYGEMAGLRARDVDLAAKVIRVRVALPQTSKRHHGAYDPKPLKSRHSKRDVPMSDELAEALAVVAGMSPDAPVFAPAHDESWVYSCWLKQWRKLVASVDDVPDKLRVHDLRHSCAMRWLRNGVPLGLVSKMLGHANVAITDAMYVRWDERDRAAIVSAGLSA